MARLNRQQRRAAARAQAREGRAAAHRGDRPVTAPVRLRCKGQRQAERLASQIRSEGKAQARAQGADCVITAEHPVYAAFVMRWAARYGYCTKADAEKAIATGHATVEG